MSAIERITGTVHGKSGSFVIQHTGTMHAGERQLAIRMEGSKHFYDLHYTLGK